MDVAKIKKAANAAFSYPENRVDIAITEQRQKKLLQQQEQQLQK